MADLSRHTSDLRGHPDASEMQERYARVLGERDVVLVDGPVLLAGLYLAVSPWVVHFSGNVDLTTHNLIVGVCIALLGLGLTLAPERMYGLSWAMCAVGAWLIVSPWVVTRFPDAGMIWNNVIVGAVTCLLGLAAAGVVMRNSRSRAT
ncbi:SPW repeat protein [Streptomyces sp. NPDC018031]|uniref:SPW repeat protein n=1 Tax=Streptomyces sp. NPDC018031 TaxID=3365033 RepID=UPI0037B130EE